MPPAKKTEAPTAVLQEKCSSCNHPETFHRSTEGCKVMACECAGWNGRKGTKKAKKAAKKK